MGTMGCAVGWSWGVNRHDQTLKPQRAWHKQTLMLELELGQTLELKPELKQTLEQVPDLHQTIEHTRTWRYLGSEEE